MYSLLIIYIFKYLYVLYNMVVILQLCVFAVYAIDWRFTIHKGVHLQQ